MPGTSGCGLSVGTVRVGKEFGVSADRAEVRALRVVTHTEELLLLALSLVQLVLQSLEHSTKSSVSETNLTGTAKIFKYTSKQ